MGRVQAGFHATLNNSYGPLQSAIPLSLARQSAASAPAPPVAEKPAEARVDAVTVGGPDATDADGYDEFAHPAAVEPQRVVWVPRDGLGLGEAEARAIGEMGIRVSLDDARMDEKGHVDISGPPPDETKEAD